MSYSMLTPNGKIWNRYTNRKVYTQFTYRCADFKTTTRDEFILILCISIVGAAVIVFVIVGVIMSGLNKKRWS